MSANPLLVHPTHYTGEPGYITDTENSPIVDDETFDKLKGNLEDESGVVEDEIVGKRKGDTGADLNISDDIACRTEL